MKGTILLVEDNPDDEALTVRALRNSNLVNDIVIAHDGVEALNYLMNAVERGQDGEKLPDIMLADLKLPKIGGLELLRRVRANKRTNLLPVVILTSSKEESDLVSAYDLGANSYIQKPVDSIRFEAVVRHLETYWLAVNESPPRLGAER